MPYATANNATFTPMPSARVITASAVNAGLLRMARKV